MRDHFPDDGLEDRHSYLVHMAIIPFSNTGGYIAMMIPIMALMEKAKSRKIVTRFSVSQSVLLAMLVIIAPHPLNRVLVL